jgi:hypothetical protein
MKRFLAGVRARALNALAHYLARPVRSYSRSQTADTQSLGSVLRVGDVLLSSGATRAARIVRRATRSGWAHVSMYVGPLDAGADALCVVEADIAAGVRAVPLSSFAGQRVCVLRPTGLSDDEVRRLAEWVVSRLGDPYDLALAWALALRLLRIPLRDAAPAMEGATRFICSSLLAQAFVMVGQQIPPTQLRPRVASPADHRYVTPRDFEKAAGFEVISRT